MDPAPPRGVRHSWASLRLESLTYAVPVTHYPHDVDVLDSSFGNVADTRLQHAPVLRSFNSPVDSKPKFWAIPQAPMTTGALMVGIYGLGTGLTAAAAGYACAALGAVLKRPRARSSSSASDTRPLLPVSVLKPLHGAEPRLHENLRDFCLHAQHDYELILG